MQLICISRGSYTAGKELAERLAEKLGYRCMSREELLDEAASRGIAVGKLEMAMIKTQPLTERMAIERDHYQALATSILCETALKENLIYHGRTGHLLLPGMSHILRVRVVSDMEYRIKAVMQRLNLPREKARNYIEKVEDDRRRWVRYFYNVDWDVSSLYDVTVNLQYMNIDNASTALCAMAQLPDFQETPASRKAMEDLLLASRTRLAIAEDERTWEAQVKVSAQNGVVSVTHLPHQAKIGQRIPEVLGDVDGIRELVCTMARTNILWIQERFSPGSTSFRQMIEIASKWGAAIELIRMIPVEEDEFVETQAEEFATVDGSAPGVHLGPKRYEGGIVDDTEGEMIEEDEGVRNTREELIRLGLAGGCRTVQGTPRRLLSVIDRSVRYSLIVIGDVFLAKGRSVQTRLTRELGSFLGDQLKVPTVMSDELETQFLFGRKQLAQLVVFLLSALILYTLVFTNQEAILRFLYTEETTLKILRVAAVFAFIPIIAYVYGSAARLILKMLKIE